MQKYLGWTNQYTWIVNLWWTNDEYAEAWLKELVNSCEDVYELKKEIYSVISEVTRKYRIDLQNNDVNTNMLFNILDLAINRIDYHQLASNWFEDYKIKD